MEPRRWVRHIAPIVAVGIVSIAVSISVSYLARVSEHSTLVQEFSARAHNQATILQGGLDEYLGKLRGVRALFESSNGAVTREQFESFSNSLLGGHAAILNIAWIPRVRREQRVAHELAAARDGLPNYRIRSIVPDGSLPVSPERDEYFPKFYSTETRTSPVYGLDLNDGGPRARVVSRIRDGDVLSTSPPLILHIGEGDRRGFWAGLPVYVPGQPHETVEERRRNLLGIVQGVFQIGVLIDTVLADVKTPVRLYLFAPNARSDDAPVYFASRGGTDTIEARSQTELAAGLHRSFPINFGDVPWTLIVAPDPGSRAGEYELSTIMLVFGLLLSGALTGFLLVMRRSSDRFEIQHLRFEAALDNMAQGLLIFDVAGKLITSNRRAAELFGVPWQKWESSAVGATHSQIIQIVHDSGMLTDSVRAQITSELQSVLDGNKAGSVDFERADGRMFSASCAPMPDSGVVVTFGDMTERHTTLRRTQAQLEVVGRLSEIDVLASNDVDSFARQVTELAAKATGCERLNAWLFNDDETELRCIDLFELSSGRHSAGMVLNEREFKNEFHVLRESRYVNADDALTDPRTAGYVESYLKPLGITAMLDAVIHTDGKNLGLLCFEHVNKPHHWEQDEISFACQLADKIGLMLLNRRRHEVEQKLQFAHTLLTTELETSPDAILVVDKAGKIVSFNRRFVELWKIPQALVDARVDDPVLATVSAQMQDPDAFLARVGYLVAHPDEKGEDELTTKDGRIIDRHTAPLKTADGQYLGRVWFFRDVTEKRRAEIALRDERDFTATLIDSLPGFFVLLDASGRFIRWNENLPAMLGVAEEQLEGGDAFKIIAEHDRELARRQMRVAFSQGRADAEFDVLVKDGQLRRVLWNGRKLVSEERPYLLAVGFDVTETREAERRLRASEERFRAVSETAQDAIIMTDAVGRVTFWNRAAKRTFGYTEEEAIGKDVHEWLTPARFREKAKAGMAKFARTGRGDVLGKTIELAATRKDGVEIPVELSVAGMRLGAEWHAVAILRDITERKHAEEQMARMARHDILTGLANRAVFVEALQIAMVSARRNGKGFAVLYLDLDHFKDINDTLGHPVGDLLLQAVSQRLQSTIRDTDTVARFGGDEFAVVETDIGDPADAAVMADNILKVLREPFPIQGNDIRTGASVGIAVYGPDSPDPESLLSHADVALYRAKAEGRGTYRFFTDAMDSEVRSRVSLGSELREAIASEQLFLMYQPQVDVDTGCIAGVEALVRWRHPTRGVISPAEFIPVAEKNGLIVALGHWVLRESCRQMKQWLDAGIAPPLIAVNVSGLQFKTPFELENGIASILAETNVPPQRLELELTESVLMKASEQHNDVVLRLRNSGLRIAIDDFGTGYSSLEYLGRFPIDRIKIAQDFIIDLTSGSNNATIVKAAIGLANDLKRNVIVEGVETAEQLALIRSWGCHDVQGFYFSKPLTARGITKLLRNRTILPAHTIVTDTAA